MTTDQTPTPPAARMAKSEAVGTLIVKREYHDNGQGPRDTEGYLVALAVANLRAEQLPIGRYPLYAAPQQEAERQPLSTSECVRALEGCFHAPDEDDSIEDVHAHERFSVAIVRAVEQFHRIGITGPATQETKHG